MTPAIQLNDKDILIVVDIQNDFCPGGALAVPKGDEVIRPINALAKRFRNVVLTQDWHPLGHQSFASTHRDRKPFDTFPTPYGTQILWPDHCIQGTVGADFHKDLDISHAAAIVRKGIHPQIDSYSTFYENDRTTPTGLVGYMREREFVQVFLAGLALDFCVRFSAEDARREGLSVVVVENCCRAIDTNGSLAETQQIFAAIGLTCTSSERIA